MIFSNTLLDWYAENKRSLEWRDTKNPYKIWISEIILQQTQVIQGRPYYRKFIKAYPAINNLAEAPIDDVMKLWEGLGYYSRARHLHNTAKYIVYNLKNCFPDNYDDLIKLKGIGDYTASAIASFCFGECVPTLDGNVYRVLSRYFGIEVPINSSPAKRIFKKLAFEVMNIEHIASYNQAIMEFGALQCRPKGVDCSLCVLNKNCVAFNTGKVAQLPVKKGKIKIRNRYFNYFIIRDKNNKVLLQRRNSNDIWKHLYEYPLIEVQSLVSEEELKSNQKLRELTKTSLELKLLTPKQITHKLTHQHLHTQIWYSELNTELEKGVHITDLKSYPMPVLLSKFTKDFVAFL